MSIRRGATINAKFADQYAADLRELAVRWDLRTQIFLKLLSVPGRLNTPEACLAEADAASRLEIVKRGADLDELIAQFKAREV